MIKVNNIITVYDLKYDKDRAVPDDSIVIKNHWNDPDMVVINIGNQEFTVVARDVISAVNNATNVNRY